MNEHFNHLIRSSIEDCPTKRVTSVLYGLGYWDPYWRVFLSIFFNIFPDKFSKMKNIFHRFHHNLLCFTNVLFNSRSKWSVSSIFPSYHPDSSDYSPKFSSRFLVGGSVFCKHFKWHMIDIYLYTTWQQKCILAQLQYRQGIALWITVINIMGRTIKSLILGNSQQAL